MFNFNINNYVDNVAQTPKEYYRSLIQATINDQWDNTTQLYTIKEQRALPFEDEYDEHEVWVATVSDDLINYSKVYSNFIRIWFRDIDHKQNYKGQYYKLALDNEHEETYICYDRINPILETSDFKCVRCNNVLTWKDKNGKIITMPCYLGTDITSTNNLIGKDGLTPNVRMIILIQANEYTKSIVENQRFMFEHSTVVKVEEVNNYMQEEGTEGQVTCVKIYVNYSAERPTDNKELNICDDNENNYSIVINQENISQVKGFVGKLTANIFNNDEIVDNKKELLWKSENVKVAIIDEFGNYSIVGDVGDSAKVMCYMKDNPLIYNEITITVVEDYVQQKEIILNPIINILKEKETIDIDCGVYIEGEVQTQEVSCIPSGAKSTNYSLVKIDGGYRLTNVKRTTTPLKLTFSSDDCEDKIISITLGGII